ncbi:hypothetical protein P9112_002528 [Eukaryota sp. TZLM1-RC]
MFTLSNNDSKAAQSLKRRQELAESRLQRIHDTKSLSIGVDTQALDQQIEENRNMASTRAVEDFLHDKHLLSLERQLLARTAQQTKTERELLQNLNEFRTIHQRPEMSDTYDLNNRKAQHNELSAFEKFMKNDPGVQIGPSSAIIFEGEDLDHHERTKKQQEQMARWTREQVNLKKEEAERRALEDAMYDQKLLDIVQEVNRLQEETDQANRNQMMSLLSDNMALANEMHRKKQEELALDKQLSQIHEETVVNSQLMTEDPNCTISCLNSNRKVPYNFKGMNNEELSRILNERDHQMNEKKRIISEFKKQQHMHDACLIKQARQLEILQKRKAREEREAAIKLRQDLLQQSRCHKRKETDEARSRTDLIVGDEFLNSFGRSFR